MVKNNPPVIITAIADTDAESFIAGTLFSQGWNVIFRALDAQSLTDYLDNNVELSRTALLLYSPDLPDFSRRKLDGYALLVRKVVGFGDKDDLTSEYSEIYAFPKDANELISMVRGFIRTPLIRPTIFETKKKRQALVLAVGSAGTCTGASTVALNIASELALLDKKTLLIDAHFSAPSISTFLDERKLQDDDDWREVSPNFFVAEFNRINSSQHISRLTQAENNFDHIVIDLGDVGNFSSHLTDQRWQSSIITWSAESADTIWVLSRSDLLGNERFNQLCKVLSRTAITGELGFILNLATPSRKSSNEEKEFRMITAPFPTCALYILPRDVRGVSSSVRERTTLSEAAERSPMRKIIEEMARDLTA